MAKSAGKTRQFALLQTGPQESQEHRQPQGLGWARPLGQLMAVCTLRCSPLEMLTWLFSVSFDVLIGAIR